MAAPTDPTGAPGPDAASRDGDDDEPFDPSSIVDPPPQPLLSARRALILVAVLAAVGILVWGSTRTAKGEGGGTGCSNLAVAAWDPCPGARVLRQAQVGVELQPGYDGRISVNGIEVPESQMQGAILPGTPAYDRLSPEERKLGPRPNNKNVVKFQPGPGKVVTRFSGQVDIAVRYWKQADGEDSAQTLNYAVFVT